MTEVISTFGHCKIICFHKKCFLHINHQGPNNPEYYEKHCYPFGNNRNMVCNKFDKLCHFVTSPYSLPVLFLLKLSQVLSPDYVVPAGLQGDGALTQRVSDVPQGDKAYSVALPRNIFLHTLLLLHVSIGVYHE